MATSRFNRLAVAAGLAPETTARIATVVANLGPLSDDALLLGAGVSPSDLARLSAFIVLLPPDAGLNLNTADARLLEALIDDPAAVRRILSLRAAKGQVTEADLAVVGLTGLGGYTSNHFALTATVSVGDVSQTTRSRLTRTVDPAGVHVGVTQRRRSAN